MRTLTAAARCLDMFGVEIDYFNVLGCLRWVARKSQEIYMSTLDIPEGEFENAAERLTDAAASLRSASGISEIESLITASLPGGWDVGNSAHLAGDACDRESDRIVLLLEQAVEDALFVAQDLNDVDARFAYAFDVEMDG
nr:hypothetical protein [Pseudoclavibacter sp. Marseille-Q3772]